MQKFSLLVLAWGALQIKKSTFYFYYKSGTQIETWKNKCHNITTLQHYIITTSNQLYNIIKTHHIVKTLQQMLKYFIIASFQRHNVTKLHNHQLCNITTFLLALANCNFTKLSTFATEQYYIITTLQQCKTTTL